MEEQSRGLPFWLHQNYVTATVYNTQNSSNPNIYGIPRARRETRRSLDLSAQLHLLAEIPIRSPRVEPTGSYRGVLRYALALLGLLSTNGYH